MFFLPAFSRLVLLRRLCVRCFSPSRHTGRRNPLLSTRAKKRRALIYIQQILPRRRRSLSRQQRTDNPRRGSYEPLLAVLFDAALYPNVSRVTKIDTIGHHQVSPLFLIRVKFSVYSVGRKGFNAAFEDYGFVLHEFTRPKEPQARRCNRRKV